MYSSRINLQFARTLPIRWGKVTPRFPFRKSFNCINDDLKKIENLSTLPLTPHNWIEIKSSYKALGKKVDKYGYKTKLNLICETQKTVSKLGKECDDIIVHLNNYSTIPKCNIMIRGLFNSCICIGAIYTLYCLIGKYIFVLFTAGIGYCILCLFPAFIIICMPLLFFSDSATGITLLLEGVFIIGILSGFIFAIASYMFGNFVTNDIATKIKEKERKNETQ